MARVSTARGFRDVLPQEAEERRAVVQAVDGLFQRWGYRPVETPVVEEYQTLETAAGPLEGTAFRLFDLDGRLLALRPDLTMPLARLAASRLLPLSTGPHRLRYEAPVFREHASLQGQPRQFTQLGVELVGTAAAWADAEVVSVCVEALRFAGLEEFTVAVGTVEVLQALLVAAAVDDAWKAAVLDAVHDANLVELDRLARTRGIPRPVGEALREVPRLRGGRKAIEECGELVAGLGCDAALQRFEESWTLLEETGAARHAVVDFGVARSFEYYTGLVFEAYAPGIGAPLGGGGRYDRVLAAFGEPAPAAGFALGLERLHMALEAHDRVPKAAGVEILLGGDPRKAFAAAGRLRDRGLRVVLLPGWSGERISRRAAETGGMPMIADEEGVFGLDERGRRTTRHEDEGTPA